ncbi:MAG: hypothetical protein J5950_02425 [Clostridia bacterium]|nr:hypothetical protein [Clostridia bacterium]
MSGKYDDIIDMPHHVSASRKHMTMVERAAQFAPFAALRGYDEEIDSNNEAVNSAAYRDDLFDMEEPENFVFFETGETD